MVVGAALAVWASTVERDRAAQRAEAARAAEAARVWDDPGVQRRWSGAVVVPAPLVEPAPGGPADSVITRLRRGLVEPAARLRDDGGAGVVDLDAAPDQQVPTLGARSALRAFRGPLTGCPNDGDCTPVRVTDATPTTMSAPTARGAATVPAWSFRVDGLSVPLVLPAVPVVAPEEVAPGRDTSSRAYLLGREGSTLRVTLVAPYCGNEYERHLLETDTTIVVWATGAPGDYDCAVAETRVETFTLTSPVGDRPVVDIVASLVMPETPWRPSLE